MKKIMLPFLLLVFCQPLFAQQEAPVRGPVITLHLGVYHAGSGQDVEKKMRDNGFGEERFGAFFGPEDNPQREEGSVQLGILYPLRMLQVKGLVNYRNADVSGYEIFYENLDLNTSVLSIAALGYVPLNFPYFRLGAGPAFHLAKATLIHKEEEKSDKSFSKIGFVLESGLSYPANRRFYGDLQVQYLYAGKADVGSHTLQTTDAMNRPTSRQVNFSETSFNSFTVSVGAGFRFR